MTSTTYVCRFEFTACTTDSRIVRNLAELEFNTKSRQTPDELKEDRVLREVITRQIKRGYKEILILNVKSIEKKV